MKNKPWLEEFDTLIKNGKLTKAKILLEEHKGSIEIGEFHYLYSILYCEQELYHKALSHAEKAYKTNPKDLDKAQIYSWVLSSASPKDFEENSDALSIIEYVINQREKGGSNEDLLYDLNVKSHILYRLGRHDEARKNVNKTTSLFPNSHLPRFIQLFYESGASSSAIRKPNVVDPQNPFSKWIMTIVAAIIATLISAYIIKVIL